LHVTLTCVFHSSFPIWFRTTFWQDRNLALKDQAATYARVSIATIGNTCQKFLLAHVETLLSLEIWDTLSCMYSKTPYCLFQTNNSLCDFVFCPIIEIIFLCYHESILFVLNVLSFLKNIIESLLQRFCFVVCLLANRHSIRLSKSCPYIIVAGIWCQFIS